MAKRNANPIDVHVGNRVRMRRMLIGMSQEKLGDQLGLTFQQVQKYEKGSNRVSASRLFRMTQILGVNVQFFYDDMPGSVSGLPSTGFAENKNGELIMDLISSAEGLHLNQAFIKIKDADVRRRMRFRSDLGPYESGTPSKDECSFQQKERDMWHCFLSPQTW
jgi:transcriptional regulator with XRE-family HTH domain